MPSYDESSPLLDRNIFDGWIHKIKTRLSGRNAVLALYLVLVVVIGTANRVTFKIMQYATTNYSYFDSQATTLVYVPINFAIIFFKIFFTKSITPEMRNFPKYKFAVMGLLDSLQGLLIVVGGVHVPGIMQSLLLQGAVPVTMMFSIAMLRERGCERCRNVRATLKKKGVNFQEVSTFPEKCSTTTGVGGCLCRLTVNGMEVDIYNLENESLLEGLRVQNRKVVLETSARSWLEHIKNFYVPAQYIGAAIVLAGLVVSMWPAFVSKSFQGAGPPLFDMIFFLATIPTAISGVYKEIAFRETEDMDVWYLNGWVALFQFLFGLLYAPLAAKMSDLPIKQIPDNLYHGLECVILGHNTIVNTTLSACASQFPCGTGDTLACCDSCDGSLPYISEVPALWGILMYMAANILYNIFLILVIKYGSAALMYIASTLVLPLGSISFTIRAFFGHNTQKFTPYTGAGLGVVLAGLIVYRFLGKKKQVEGEETEERVMTIGTVEPLILERKARPVTIRPRSKVQIRNSFYARLGMTMPDTVYDRAAINT